MAFAATLCVFSAARDGLGDPPSSAPTISPTEKRRAEAQIIVANGGDDAAPADVVEALLKLLDRTTAMTKPSEVDDCYDLDRMYEACLALTANADIFKSPQAKDAFQVKVRERLADWPRRENVVKSRITRVKLLGDEDALVYLKHRLQNDLGTKTRWWAHREGTKWQWYDFEDLDAGLRLTIVMAIVVDQLTEKGADERRAEALQNVIKGSQLLLQSDHEGAEKALRATLNVPLPPILAAWRQAQLAAVEMVKADCEEALKLVDSAQALYADMPMLNLQRAFALNALGRFDEAETAARKYLKELGDDDTGDWALGTALAGRGKIAAAAEAFCNGLDDYSDSVDNLVGLAGVLPDDALDELADRFTAFDKPSARFVEIANQLVDNESTAALAVLVERHRQISPDNPYNDYYQGEVYWARQEFDRAAEAFRKAFAKAPDNERESFGKALRNSLLYAGKPLEAYDAFPEGEDTFMVLCNQMIDEQKADDLDELVSRHEKRRPDDVMLAYFRAEAQFLRGKPAEAAAIFEPELGKEMPEDHRQSYTREYLSCMQNIGKAVEGYRAVPNAAFAFKFTANLLVQHWDDDELAELIAAHSERQPQDAWLGYYRGRLLMLRGFYNCAAEHLRPLVAAGTEDEELKRSLAEAYSDALLYGGKPEDAYSVALDREQIFGKIAEKLADELDAENLVKLIARREAEQPEDALLAYYKARVAEIDGDHRAAADLLVAALKNAEGEDRARMATLLCECLFEIHQPLEAYHALRPDEAFGNLAWSLANNGDADLLAQLVAAHREQHPDEPLLTYFHGRIAHLRGDDAAAARAYLEWFKKVKDDDGEGEWSDTFLTAMANCRRPLEAYAAVDNSAAAFEILAGELADSRDADLLDSLIAEHVKEHADDPAVDYWKGRCALLRGNERDAAAAFERVLRATSADEDYLAASALDEFRLLGQSLAAYAIMSERADAGSAFCSLADELLSDRDYECLEQLIESHAAQHGDDPTISYYRAEYLLAKGKSDEVAALLKPVLSADDEYQASRQNVYERAMLKLGRWRELYDAADDKRAAMMDLSSSMFDARDADALRALVDLHRARDADDPMIAFQEAQLLRLKGQFDEADEVFAALLANAAVEPYWRRITAERRELYLQCGRAVAAYDEISPRRFTFDLLIERINKQETLRQFEDLIAAHRQRSPRDTGLALWNLEILELKGDDEALLRALDETAALLPARGERPAFLMRIRALVRLKRFDDARDALAASQRYSWSPYLRAVVETAAGDAAAAGAALTDLLRSGYRVQRLYQDAIIGPALKSDRFADFRERFPEWVDP